MSSHDGHAFLYDPKKEILENTLLRTRVMVWDADFVKALSESLRRSFQSGAVVILYQMGLAYGELLGKRILESGGLGSHTEGVYRQRYASLAVGKFQFPSLATVASGGPPSQMKITLEDSFFAQSLGRTGQPECHIVRGLVEGTAKVVLKLDYVCQEVRCLSKGDSLCEFIVAPRPKG
jgi:predicted hydrocarbon binding protein